MIFLSAILNNTGMMMSIKNNGENMEGAGSAGVAVNLKNIKVMSASKSQNMDEARVERHEEVLRDSWDDEEEEEDENSTTQEPPLAPDQKSASVMKAVTEEWDDEADADEQMACVRKATLRAIAVKEVAEAKAVANHAKQVKRLARSGNGPKLTLGKFGWLSALMTGKESVITGCDTFRKQPMPVKKQMLALVQQSREATAFREDKMHAKISELGYGGGDEGDSTEGRVVAEQSKKLGDKLALVWRTHEETAKAWSLAVRGEKPAVVVAMTRVLTPVSSPVAAQLAAVISPKEAMVADIMAGIGKRSGVEASAPAPTERDNGFDVMAKAKEEARKNPVAFSCTRPCDEFKTGVTCRHRAAGRKCNWGHCVEQLQPKKCAWPTTCNKFHKRGGACECAHEVDGELETPHAVVARLVETRTLMKALPESDTPMQKDMQKKTPATVVGAVNSAMTAKDKRAATDKHREQLETLKTMSEPVKVVPCQPRRPTVNKGADRYAEPSEGAWPKPSEKTWAKPEEQECKMAEVVVEEPKVFKPVMRCTPEMAIQMMQLMKQGGLNIESVVFEIIS